MTNLLGQQGKVLRYALLVVLPTLAVLAYNGLLASDGYVSRAHVMIEHDTPVPTPELAIGDLLGSAPSKVDALIVKTFMESRAMLEYLEQELGVRAHFSSEQIDWWSRLPSDASREELLKYYLDHLEVTVDQESFVVEVAFTAYDPEFAQKVADMLVARSETFVNDVSHHLAREQLAFIEGEVERAQQKLKKASRDMVELQRKYEVFSPEKESESAGMVIGGLLQQLAQQQATLKALESYMNPGAQQVVEAQRKIAALKKQIAEQRAELVGSDDEEGLNELMLNYQDAEVNLNVATEVYKSAIGTLEMTRLETARKAKYLVSLSAPSLAEEAYHPRIAYWTLTVFVFLNLAYFVLGLIIATIQDHRE